MQIVCNGHEGFRLSDEALEHYNDLRAIHQLDSLEQSQLSPELIRSMRRDPLFVATVEALGERAHLHDIAFRIVSLDDELYENNLWHLDEYDGAADVRINERAVELWEQLKNVREGLAIMATMADS